MLSIKPTDCVLEIGSGNRPRRRSNVLCDKFIDNNYERSSGDNVVIDRRPFVVADGHALPFADKSFDYVITSHILEHVDDPVKFTSELTRIAKSGYIETPSELAEKIFGWPFHKWIVRIENGTLILRPRKSDSAFGDYFHRMYQHDGTFAEFVDTHYEDFYVQHEWHGSIAIRVEDDASEKVKFSVNPVRLHPYSAFKKSKIALARLALPLYLRVIRRFRKFEL